MEKLGGKKGKAKTNQRVERKNREEESDEEEDDNEFVTQVTTRNDLTLDYTQIVNVKERLEILTQERFKGKYSASFHV